MERVGDEQEGPAASSSSASGRQQAAVPGPGATFSIQPPGQFDFSTPKDWERWIRRFERFRQASNLHSSSQENQVNTLVYCMGDEADDVLKGLNLSYHRQKQYDAVREAFQAFFIVAKNVIYERARFNMRKQEENESVDSFVTALYTLSEHCDYGALHNELIRDRIVVGLADIKLSERMQMDKDLTLDKAINMARQSEEIKRQQTSLRGDTCAKEARSVDRVAFKGKQQYQKKPIPRAQKERGKYVNSEKSKQCRKCGKSPSHPPSQCPANDITCRGCGKKGHYQRVCLSSKTVNVVEEDSEEDSLFLGSVTAGKEDPWTVNLLLKNRKVQFSTLLPPAH